MCDQLTAKGFVPSMVLGIGSYTYQMVTRDTFGFALKSTLHAVRNCAFEPVYLNGKRDYTSNLHDIRERLRS